MQTEHIPYIFYNLLKLDGPARGPSWLVSRCPLGEVPAAVSGHRAVGPVLGRRAAGEEARQTCLTCAVSVLVGSSASSVPVSGSEGAAEAAPTGPQPGDVRDGAALPRGAEESVWSSIARTPERVLMTYQVPAR